MQKLAPLDRYTEAELAKALRQQGYTVKEPGFDRRAITWNRTEPFPDHIDFKVEAVEKISQQVNEHDIQFTVTEPLVIDGKEVRPAIHTAELRIA